MRPACCSCKKRRSTAEPPERNISTLTPLDVSKALTILLAVSIGVEVYQTTLPSFFAASTSTASAAAAGRASGMSIVSAMRRADRLQGVMGVLQPDRLPLRGQRGLVVRSGEHADVRRVDRDADGLADLELLLRMGLDAQHIAGREPHIVLVDVADDGT